MIVPNHDALCFWCDAYQSGVRITHDGNQFAYHAVDYLRIHRTKRFGLLEIQPCEPPLDIVAEAEARQATLVPMLTQPIPSDLTYWWYHILSLDYEGKPVLRMAARRKTSVWLLPCRGGVWPMVVPCQFDDDANSGMPALSQILINHGYSFHQPAYQILGESHVRRTNGNNHMGERLGAKVSAGSTGK